MKLFIRVLTLPAVSRVLARSKICTFLLIVLCQEVWPELVDEIAAKKRSLTVLL